MVPAYVIHSPSGWRKVRSLPGLALADREVSASAAVGGGVSWPGRDGVVLCPGQDGEEGEAAVGFGDELMCPEFRERTGTLLRKIMADRPETKPEFLGGKPTIEG